MDTFAHGFWSYLIWSFIGNPWLAVFAGTLPDLLAFTPITTYYFFQRSKKKDFVQDYESLPKILRSWADNTYNVTHTLFLPLIMIPTVFFFWGFQWWLLAWPLHVLIDIPTHQKKFFPTPFLWPVSSFVVDGMSWAKKSFMIPNYLLLFIGYAYLLASAISF